MEEALRRYGRQEIQRNSLRREVVRSADREESQDEGLEEFHEAKATKEEHRRQEEWEEETILQLGPLRPQR